MYEYVLASALFPKVWIRPGRGQSAILAVQSPDDYSPNINTFLVIAILHELINTYETIFYIWILFYHIVEAQLLFVTVREKTTFD